ncbi:hypothetical protein [Solibacillus sp. FSL W8-0372]|uniref:hypothetical protein n=1 Tax=Solibacillus sp. FSL W8-0372 TaxID=2921713 RepID=UPI0030CE770A
MNISLSFQPIQPLYTIATLMINVDGFLLETLLVGKEKANTQGQLDALKFYLKTVLQINERGVSMILKKRKRK